MITSTRAGLRSSFTTLRARLTAGWIFAGSSIDPSLKMSKDFASVAKLNSVQSLYMSTSILALGWDLAWTGVGLLAGTVMAGERVSSVLLTGPRSLFTPNAIH